MSQKVGGSGVAAIPPFPPMFETVIVALPIAPPSFNETLMLENVPNNRVEVLLNISAPVK